MERNALVVQIYKKHTYKCAEPICYSGSYDGSKKHESIFLLSYYDGMCVNEITNLRYYINDRFCNKCNKKMESEIHSDIRKLLLYNPNSNVSVDMFDGDKPLFAFIGVKAVLPRQKEDLIDTIKSVLLNDDQTSSNVFWSLGIDDYYICIATNDWNSVNKTLYKLRDEASKAKIMLQTNTILGFHSRLINEPNSYRSILETEYEFRTMVKLRYGIQLNNICDILEKELAENHNITAQPVGLTMGIYDVELTFRTTIQNFVNLICNNGILGTDSEYIEYSSTSVKFDFPSNIDIECKGPFFDKEQYDSLVKSMVEGFKDHNTINISSSDDLDEQIVFSFINSYTSCGKQLYSFPCFIDFAQIGKALCKYKEILTNMVTSLESMKTEQPAQFDLACHEIEESLRSITTDLMTLADDRLSTDFPISDRVDNNIYEKGAYERLIKAWSNYIDRVKSICGAKNNTFLIIPQLNCSTITNVHFPNSSDTKKFITVNLSISDIIKFQHLMVVLAHEVGHYCTEDKYVSNTLMRLYILFTVNITVDGILRSLSSEQQLSYDDWVHKIGRELSLSICDMVLSKVDFNDCSYDKCNKEILKIFDIVKKAIRSNDIQNVSKTRAYENIISYCNRILRHFAIFETDVFSPTIFSNVFKSTFKAASAFSKELVNETNADIFMIARLGIDAITYERNFQEEYQFDIDRLKSAIPYNVFLQPQEALFLRMLCVICAISSHDKSEIVEDLYLVKIYNSIRQQDDFDAVNSVNSSILTEFDDTCFNKKHKNSFLVFISALTANMLIPELTMLYKYYLSNRDDLLSKEQHDLFFSNNQSSINMMIEFMSAFGKERSFK